MGSFVAFLQLLIAVGLAACSCADGFQVSLKRIESLHSKLIRNGTWTTYPRLKSARFSASTQPLIDYDDGEYVANVSIGTPPQTFLVLLDFNTAGFWVPDKSCPSAKCPWWCKDGVYCKGMCDPRCCSSRNVARLSPKELGTIGDCGWRNRFDSSKSSTYRKNGTRFTDLTGDGFVGIDTVRLGGPGGLTVPTQTFGQATSASFSTNDAYDGILGIGPSSFLYLVPGIVPLLDNAKEQGIIKNNIITLALIREGTQSPDLPGGSITYGALDPTNCDGAIYYVPALEGNPSVVPLEGVALGNTKKGPDANVPWQADFGFTTTALSGPIGVTDALARAAGAKGDGSGFYTISCNATVPSLFLTFYGQQFEIPPSELVRPQGTGDSSDCLFNLFGQTEHANVFSFGASIGRKYCLIFDYDNVRLRLSANLYST